MIPCPPFCCARACLIQDKIDSIMERHEIIGVYTRRIAGCHLRRGAAGGAAVSRVCQRAGTGPGHRLRHADGYLGNPIVDRMGWWWFNLAEIVESRSWRDLEILRCPSRRQEDPMLEPDILCGNYGANWSLCKSTSYPGPYGEEFVGSPLSSTDVPEPGATLLLVDSGYSLISWWHAAEEPPGQFGSSIQDSAYIPGLEINADRKLWPGLRRRPRRPEKGERAPRGKDRRGRLRLQSPVGS